jgi:hypothetical protein
MRFLEFHEPILRSVRGSFFWLDPSGNVISNANIISNPIHFVGKNWRPEILVLNVWEAWSIQWTILSVIAELRETARFRKRNFLCWIQTPLSVQKVAMYDFYACASLNSYLKAIRASHEYGSSRVRYPIHHRSFESRILSREFWVDVSFTCLDGIVLPFAVI